jgi:omega-amidase
MKLAGLQIDIEWEDKVANHDQVARRLAAAGFEPGTLVVLPEMFATGFSMNAAGIDDTETQASQSFLRRMATTHQIWIQAGLVTRRTDGRPANQSVVYDPTGTEVARYDKIFPFAPGGELEHYAAGERVVLYSWGGFTVASFICYDLRFPEIFRLAAARGANLYTVIASWPERRTGHWVALLQARAIENQAWVIGVNRCGRDPYLGYSGRSLIIDPHGTIVSDAGTGEGLITATLDRAALDEYRTSLPFLRDMRPIAGE